MIDLKGKMAFGACIHHLFKKGVLILTFTLIIPIICTGGEVYEIGRDDETLRFKKNTLARGMRVQATSDAGRVRQGMKGEFFSFWDDTKKNACVIWDEEVGSCARLPDGYPEDKLRHCYYVNPSDIKILDTGLAMPSLKIHKPKFTENVSYLSEQDGAIRIIGKVAPPDGVSSVKCNDATAKLNTNTGTFSYELPVTHGTNKIRISIMTENGTIYFSDYKLIKETDTAYKDERRLALLIGNANYKTSTSLKNPVNDIQAMVPKLKGLNFEVIHYLNLNKDTMDRVIKDFGDKLDGYDVGLFFYSGHAIQINGENYLLPVDVELQSEKSAERESVNAYSILSKMQAAENELNILVFDSCRDNPFQMAWNRGSTQNGMTSMVGPPDTLIAYATSAGATSSDNSMGDNGAYTTALLKELDRTQTEVHELFRRVARLVGDASDGRQIPTLTTTCRKNFYFKK